MDVINASTSGGLAIVTGAGSGIGSATAQVLHSHGFHVLALGRHEDRLREALPPEVSRAVVDIRDLSTISRVIEQAADRHGPVEVLVNNAGIMPLGDLTNQDPTEWLETMQTNCLAAFALAQLVAPSMVSRAHGTIVTVTSVAARDVFPHHGAYCASKTAAHAMCVALRGELAPHGVRVIEIQPGFVDTDVSSATTNARLRSDYLAGRPVGLAPRSVADLIAYVCQLSQDVCLDEIVVTRTDAV